ncbi:hypothetical protein TPA0910_51060 [Streptomyces hygroscopicus subsp. sporocinereus]|uniref:Uncharacterized protein n=1 Tax=Streptomyces hygroscopicus TaxID=1912 RepID=A0ABQ3U4Y2_STRHY|nr:hypothetical protein TPA0910_51060 [Streptomyces hygroscopicus]
MPGAGGTRRVTAEAVGGGEGVDAVDGAGSRLGASWCVVRGAVCRAAVVLWGADCGAVCGEWCVTSVVFGAWVRGCVGAWVRGCVVRSRAVLGAWGCGAYGGVYGA